MNCQSCNRQLTDDEVYVCAQCADEYAHLEVMEKIKGEKIGEGKNAEAQNL
ncbi:TPA: hypothetical protein KEV90_003565 [Proteus mirabilis]|uniref:protein NinF n=1 Tax=Proteus mirabilis TaxID=584 RepID=UPI001B9229FD|nr:hypothetical protein [Proteus mirabilis]MDF7209473.1 hypothetical protein [Proteus mirabilis]HBC6054848.1 hypothetical protein [Proteus mirabilis]